METLGIWIAAIGTIAILSFLYKENPIYRTVEHIFVGVSAGIGLYWGYDSIRQNAWNPLFNPAEGESRQLLMLIPLILGILLYSRFMENYKWVSRIPLGFIIGIGSALAIRGVIGASFMDQIIATMRMPLWGTMVKFGFDSLLFVVGVIGTLIYFFFSTEQKGALKYGASIGKWTMMIAFGTAFGNTVMSRVSLLIGRVYFLLGEWLQII
ncbi:hypothetical protein HYG86_07035 [Alkalicella caledoniensis]|uniref:Uncharacterized protein n=1 Tax=Alkalicella caledoniensis TaxID=2731377 RepID=A0A7G9W789_ALKCA|nr:hypothetical protein [Alkalicella caledoniensis]QNO14551.1 hypothetical protein HYG86_07035 [Alkalicella caledoniensis]